MVRRVPLLLGCIAFVAVFSVLYVQSFSRILVTSDTMRAPRLKPLPPPAVKVTLNSAINEPGQMNTPAQTSPQKSTSSPSHQRSAAPVPASDAAHLDRDSSDYGDFHVVK